MSRSESTRRPTGAEIRIRARIAAFMVAFVPWVRNREDAGITAIRRDVEAAKAAVKREDIIAATYYMDRADANFALRGFNQSNAAHVQRSEPVPVQTTKKLGRQKRRKAEPRLRLVVNNA